jgi:hypothetical protein
MNVVWNWNIRGGLERCFYFTHIQPVQAAFYDGSACGDDLFMNALVVTTKNNNPAMGDHDWVGKRGIIDNARHYAREMFLCVAHFPDLGAKKAEAHLNKTMVQVDKHNIVTPGG